MRPTHAACTLALAAITLAINDVAVPAGRSSDLARGLAIVQDACSRCHAIGKADASPLPKAPPFRDLHKRYDVEGLAEALAEGIVTGHNDMPEFVFDAPDVRAIIQYLKSLQ